MNEVAVAGLCRSAEQRAYTHDYRARADKVHSKIMKAPGLAGGRHPDNASVYELLRTV
jgi:hypothetical protein